MEVHLSADVQSKLSRIAVEQGLDDEALVRRAVERMVNDDDWFRAEVQVGLDQIAQGRTVSHVDVGTRLDAYLAGKQQPA